LVNRIAIPVFQSRVSPVLDCCSRVLLIDQEQDREIRRTEIICQNLSVLERVNLLNKSGVTLVICAGISQSFHDQLVAAGIATIPGIVGQVDAVLSAFSSNRLDNSGFRMPGYTPDRGTFEP
jgi:predicted Fe-Mo cluster-binding NifX family protein